MSLEVGSLLVIVHGHGSTRHLDHTVVNCLISVFKGLKISVLQSEKRSGGLGSLISGSNINEESYLRETISQSVSCVCHFKCLYFIYGKTVAISYKRESASADSSFNNRIIALTHMDGTWEILTLGEDGESVFEGGHSVLVWLVELSNWLVSLHDKK